MAEHGERRGIPRVRDIALAPLYITVGVGDVLYEKGRERVARGRDKVERGRERVESLGRAVPQVFAPHMSEPRTGRGVVEDLAERVGASAQKAAGKAAATAPGSPANVDDSDIPFGRGGAELRAARRRAADRRAQARNESTDGHGEHPRRSAAARTASPTPMPNHGPHAGGEDNAMAEQMTPARTARPSGVEAASTVGRAARRAARRAGHG